MIHQEIHIVPRFTLSPELLEYLESVIVDFFHVHGLHCAIVPTLIEDEDESQPQPEG